MFSWEHGSKLMSWELIRNSRADALAPKVSSQGQKPLSIVQSSKLPENLIGVTANYLRQDVFNISWSGQYASAFTDPGFLWTVEQISALSRCSNGLITQQVERYHDRSLSAQGIIKSELGTGAISSRSGCSSNNQSLLSLLQTQNWIWI